MKRSTKSQRVRLVTQWRDSGSSQAAFARRHHIHPRTFFDWIRAFPAAAPATAAAPPFVPVQVVAAPSAAIPLALGVVVVVSLRTLPSRVERIVGQQIRIRRRTDCRANDCSEVASTS